MLELLSPAGSPEGVIAAVQNGADAVYMGLGSFNARRNAANFTEEEFRKAVRYCRIRGCKVYVTMNTLVSDRETEEAVKLARLVSEVGADAILVQDLGLLSVLRAAVPDIPLHASTQMSIHSLDGARAAADMGLTRAVLARELSLEQIKYIAGNSPIETEVFVHGALCFCYSGQCYMSALIGGRSGNRGMCAQPCRMEYSLPGRMADSHPLSLKDNCLVRNLRELEEAGVACVKIEGRMKRPEYSALVTGIYSRVIKEGRAPSPDELSMLAAAFSRQGFTQGYFTGDRTDMFGIRAEEDKKDKVAERLFSEKRGQYIDTELRRVDVEFMTVAKLGEPLTAGALDTEGHRTYAKGAVVERGISRTTDAELVDRQMAKTGGTPYRCIRSQSSVDGGVFIPVANMNELRRRLLSQLGEERAAVPERRSLPLPDMPAPAAEPDRLRTVIQVRSFDQLSPELAGMKPDHLYMPVYELLEHFDSVKPFTDAGTTVAAVLPRIIPDTEVKKVSDALVKLRELGIGEALVGNLGHIRLARAAGMELRADFGMNIFNSRTLDTVRRMGFLSATASFELRLAQVRDLVKSMNTELIVYGRLPLMVTEQCIISRSEGRCNCSSPLPLSDRRGSVFPVVREPEHRNVILNSKKLYMADKLDELRGCGLWGMRLMFTTESARECVEVLNAYKGGSYTPNELTRGLYYRGVE